MIEKRISPSTLKAISEGELYTKISNFLIRNYLFINFDLHEIFGSRRYWISKNAYQGSALELNKSAEELWHEGALDGWQHFSQDTVK